MLAFGSVDGRVEYELFRFLVNCQHPFQIFDLFSSMEFQMLTHAPPNRCVTNNKANYSIKILFNDSLRIE